MRVIFLFFFFIISISLSAQLDFAGQLNKILADSPNGFQRFRDKLQESYDTTMVCYSSIDSIDGTTENSIILHRLVSMYGALIAVAVTKKEAKEMLGDWKIKLASALQGRFSMYEIKPVKEDKRGREGWRFVKDNVSVDLSISRYLDDKAVYSLGLSVAYEIAR